MSAPDEPESSRARQEALEEPKPESSRARQEAEQELRPEPLPQWVALVSVVDFPGNEDDERVQKIVPGTGVLLNCDVEPPLPSYLVLHPRFAPDPRRNDGPLSAYILAADRSGCILLQVVEGDDLPDLFLCNTHTGTVCILPPQPSYIQRAGHGIRRHASIGLIADPHHHGHFVVAQLHPATSVDQRNMLLYFTTDEDRWFIRNFDVQEAPTMRKRLFSETGVLAHDGRLWWIALAYGVFFCDPCIQQERPQLRFLPFPANCEMEGDDVGFDLRITTLLDQHRCVRLSDGNLRFVEIRGLSYNVGAPAAYPNATVWMWTLDDPEGREGSNPWTLEYMVPMAEIWDSKSYADAGLPPREVPHVALVDPNNHHVVYFFHGSKLFSVDMREKKVIACKECPVDRDHLELRSSRPIVDAWEVLPPPHKLLGYEDDYSPEDNVLHTMEGYLAESGLGLLCRRDAFCSFCRLPVCLSCCPDHKSSHHGADPGATVRIHMTKDGAAVDAKDIKRNNIGYDWRFIQRKMYDGSSYIFLRDPRQDMRNKAKCLQCGHWIQSRSRYCSAACKVVDRPNGRNTNIIQALLDSDFEHMAIRDRFCTSCRRSFASAHCAAHELHEPPAPVEAPHALAVVPLTHHNGWMLLPEELLEVAGEGIQRIEVDGHLMFPLRERDGLPDGEAGAMHAQVSGAQNMFSRRP